MASRITDKDLNSVVQRLNRITNNPATYMDENRNILIGHFHIDCAYGGNQLVQTTNTSGGVRNVLSSGFVSKRELYTLIQSYISGIYYSKETP